MKWLKRVLIVFLVLFVVLLACYYLQDRKTGKGIHDYEEYELVTGWPHLPDSVTLGNPTGIGIDTSGNIVVFCRAGREWPLFGKMPGTAIASRTILVLDPANGRLTDSWGSDLFIMPHGLTVDKQNNVWVTDVGLHQVFKFSHDGKLLFKLGKAGEPGNDSVHFNRPTDVAVADDGSFYVSDGYGNSRVLHFSKNGEYLFEWGSKGSETGKFNIPHGIVLDSAGHVYVADRENSRIQVFDSSGRFLKQFTANNFGNICSVTIDSEHQQLIGIDDLSFLKLKHRGSDVLVFDTAGVVSNRFGRSGFYKGAAGWFHDVAVDKNGDIYTTDILNNKLYKFRKITTK
ncbi:MAG: peptidyl-alpha-hydroxyglycine alpha-amidating lyase family protein [Chitinophagaceae bacterium]